MSLEENDCKFSIEYCRTEPIRRPRLLEGTRIVYPGCGMAGCSEMVLHVILGVASKRVPLT